MLLLRSLQEQNLHFSQTTKPPTSKDIKLTLIIVLFFVLCNILFITVIKIYLLWFSFVGEKLLPIDTRWRYYKIDAYNFDLVVQKKFNL